MSFLVEQIFRLQFHLDKGLDHGVVHILVHSLKELLNVGCDPPAVIICHHLLSVVQPNIVGAALKYLHNITIKFVASQFKTKYFGLRLSFALS